MVLALLAVAEDSKYTITKNSHFVDGCHRPTQAADAATGCTFNIA